MRSRIRELTTLLAAASMFATLLPSSNAQTIDRGRQFYQSVCARCHEAGVGPELRGRGLSEATVSTIARYGGNAMPAFRHSDIDDATLRQLAEFISKSAAPAKK